MQCIRLYNGRWMRYRGGYGEDREGANSTGIINLEMKNE